jgi:hypothetical protein
MQQITKASAGARFLAAASILICSAVAAHAQAYVVVNGRVLSQSEIYALERQACTSIPAGNYWLRNDGIWGYAGNPVPQGRVWEYCVQRRHPSLSERGLLYSPGELLSPYSR